MVLINVFSFKNKNQKKKNSSICRESFTNFDGLCIGHGRVTSVQFFILQFFYKVLKSNIFIYLYLLFFLNYKSTN